MLVSSLTNRLHGPEKLSPSHKQVLPPHALTGPEARPYHNHVPVIGPYPDQKNAIKRPCTAFHNSVCFMV